MKATLKAVRAANRQWFAPGNDRFFGDKECRVLIANDGKPYLVRLSSAWSDMFGHPKTFKYYVNPLGDALEILPLIAYKGLPQSFDSLDDVREWMDTADDAEVNA